MKSSSVSTEIKDTEQYFLVLLFFMLNMVGLTFNPVFEIWRVFIQMKASEHGLCCQCF